MSLNKAALDRYITQEPDTKYQEWLERVWDLIPESEISSEEQDKYKDFLEEGEEFLSYCGEQGELPTPEFAAKTLLARFNILKENPDCKTWLDVGENVKKRGY
jgi:hypothetical protein